MKTFFCVFTCLVLIAYVNSESQDYLLEALENIERLEAELAEETRSKECTPRLHDCTKNRHSCCRGEMFKDVCTCFYEEGTDNELCSCQQPWTHLTAEQVAHKIKAFTG